MLISNKNKITILFKKINLKTSLRYMQSEINNTTMPIRTSNAFVDYYRTNDDSFAPEVKEMTDYLLEGLQSQKTFSEMAGESSQILGYHIHADSFAAFIEGTRGMISRNMGENGLRDFDNGLADMDDLHLYENDNGKLKLGSNFKEIYDGYIDAIYYPHIMPNMNNAITLNSDTYYNIPVQEQSDTSSNYSDSSSNTSLESDAESSNNLTVAALTLTVFIIIQVLVQVNSWYQRKYNNSSLIGDENTSKDNNDTVLNSAYENMFYSKLSFIILLYFVPSFISLLFSLRYYYYYKYFFIKRK